MPRGARVERLLEAARRLANGASSEGQLLRQRLLETSSLSAAGIELGIDHCLETHISSADLDALLAAMPEAPSAHVLLSGNVFVAALRALVIAAAASERVIVRASRRDPALVEALLSLLPASFTLVPKLEPRLGDHVWAYGGDETLADLRTALPRGTWLHSHGHGFGVVVLETDAIADLAQAAQAIALDTALFDQRGCLSPRVVCVAGVGAEAERVAHALALALAALENQLPLGPRSLEERAEARRHRDSASYAFEVLDAGSGWVSISPELVVPVSGRNLHVVRTIDARATLLPWAPHVTCIAAGVGQALHGELARSFPGARLVALGEMQRPPLDGPVDRRQSPLGELLA